MKLKRWMTAGAAGVFLFCAGVAMTARTTSRVEQEKKFSIVDLAWIAGSWQTAASGRMQVEEHWTAVAGGSMIGMGRTVAGGKTVFYEYLRIEERADGVFYVAHPKARPGTDFKLTKSEGQEAVFENPEHDFPKKIIYRKNADGSLFARVEGPRNGQTAGEDFNYLPMKK